MLFFYADLPTSGSMIVAPWLLVAGSVAAVEGEEPKTPPVVEPPVVVTCQWNGVAMIPDASCSRTQQRRVLACTDGTQRVGRCLR